jgi:NADPH:quinone reductase-like Zn-dependent oxidoreductase
MFLSSGACGMILFGCREPTPRRRSQLGAHLFFCQVGRQIGEDFVAVTKSSTGGAGANVILDMVGGDYIERNYEAAAVEGRVVQIAFQGSPRAKPAANRPSSSWSSTSRPPRRSALPSRKRCWPPPTR